MSERAVERIGVREVAARAGVSSQTVSRVINDHPNIRPETRARVVAAMDELGYRMNNAARALGTSTTRTIGVVASDAALYGPAAGISLLEAAARSAGRWIATAYADAGDASAVDAAVAHLLAQGVDGIILLAAHAETLDVARSSARGIRVTAMHAGVGGQRQSDAAGLVVAHLVALGHRRIARLAGPADWVEALARDGGVDSALAAAGLAPGEHWRGDWTAASGAALAPRVASAARRVDGPTAIVVANDQMALGLMAGLAELDVAVPEMLSVAGFDDNPDAAYYRPALTTVRLDLAGEARRAVADALGLQGLPGPPGLPGVQGAPEPAAPELVVRASTLPV